MADDPSPDQDSRRKGWNKLRDRVKESSKLNVFKKDSGPSAPHDVDDFLRPSLASSSDRLPQMPGPKLDIDAATRRAAPQPVPLQQDVDPEDIGDASARGGGVPLYAPTQADFASGKWIPLKPQRRPGLRVGFDNGPAELIGQGGDEAEEAPILISQRRYPSHSHDPLVPNQTQVAPRSHEPSAEPPRRTLQRAPTGFNHLDGTHHRPLGNSQAPEPVVRLDGAPFQPYIPREPPLEAHRVASAGEHDRGPDMSAYQHPSAASYDQASSLSDPTGPITASTSANYGRAPAPTQQALQSPVTSSHLPYGAVGPEQIALTRGSAPPAYDDSDHGQPFQDHLPGRDPDPVAAVPKPFPPKNLRRMRADEGLTHRSTSRRSLVMPDQDDSPVSPPKDVRASLEAPYYHNRNRSQQSFDSSRPTSQQSHQSSLGPGSDMAQARQSVSSFAGMQSGQHLLTPPSTSHDASTAGSQPGRPRSGSRSIETSPSRGFRQRAISSASTTSGDGLPDLGQLRNALPQQPSYSTATGQRPQQLTPNGSNPLDRFTESLPGLRAIFRLAAESTNTSASPNDWLRCAAWWFIKGKTGVEEFVRSHGSHDPPRTRTSDGSVAPILKQHHVNLAKCWWILHEQLPMLLQNTGPQQVFVRQLEDIHSSFQRLAISMSKHEMLPAHGTLPQGLNTDIWPPTPLSHSPPDWLWVLSGQIFQGGQTDGVLPLVAVPLGDTSAVFCYGRIFANAAVQSGDDEVAQERFECVVSFVRPKNMPVVQAIVSTAGTAAVTVSVLSESQQGVHWEHTKFDHEERMLRIKLPHRLRLRIYFAPQDYNFTWNLYEHSQRISKSLTPSRSEQRLQSFALTNFLYKDSLKQDDFPRERADNCTAAMFERFNIPPRESSGRKTHQGYRLTVVTSDKIQRCVSIDFGVVAPLEFNAPSMEPSFRFQLNDPGRGRSAHMMFRDLETRNLFRDLVSGTVLGPDESVLHALPLKSLTVSRAANDSQLVPVTLTWGDLQIIDEPDAEDPRSWFPAADLSAKLRVMMYSQTGSLVDRMNDTDVEFKIRLDADAPSRLSVLRPAQRLDATVTIGPDPRETAQLRQIFEMITTGPTICSYELASPTDLQVFQRAVTGHKILYDGVSTTFAIQRRQKLVTLTKNWEAHNARVQIVEREGQWQLLAFFKGYELADALNFQLKRTDTYEKADKHGHSVKLVEAKFVLPGSNKDDWLKEGMMRDVSSRYVALEADAYAAEHEDIFVGFGSEQERDRFAEALPAPITGARKFTLLRRI